MGMYDGYVGTLLETTCPRIIGGDGNPVEDLTITDFAVVLIGPSDVEYKKSEDSSASTDDVTVAVEHLDSGAYSFSFTPDEAGAWRLLVWANDYGLEAQRDWQVGSVSTETVITGAYVTQSELEDEINNLSEYTPVGKTYATWITGRIAVASREIDGRLGHLYTVPFDPVPSIINTIALYLTASRILNPGFVGEVPADSKVVDTYYKRANDLIQAIIDGEIVLDADASTQVDTGGPQSSTISVAKVFSRSTYDSDGGLIATGTLEGL